MMEKMGDFIVRVTKPTRVERRGRKAEWREVAWGKTAMKKVGRIRTFGFYTASLICHIAFLNIKRVADAAPHRGNRP